MKQLQQDIRNGQSRVVETPTPLVKPAEVLIANAASVVSAGTEKMTRDLAKKSLLGKARARPDQLKLVLQKMRTEGVLQTYRKVQAKLDTPMTMGYSSAGVVLACGREVQEFKPGDRVASNGPHAEVVSVSRNLCAAVPDRVPLEHAAFTVIGAIALQGFRLGEVKLGETVLVIGLGLVGQLTVAVARAAGCRVLATDPDSARCELAQRMGAEVARPGLDAASIERMTSGFGADAVLIAASTPSNQPIELASGAVRRKGRVVLLGVVGLELDRRPFYFKEAEFVVSCSYGPGRYEADYEDLGRDYPPAYVRWTEQRNLSAVMQLMASGALDVGPLITHRYPIDEADQAYQLLEGGQESSMGVLFEYPGFQERRAEPRVELKPPQATDGRVGVGVIGAGGFARSVLLPQILKHPRLAPVAIASATGASALRAGEQGGFETVTTDIDQVFSDPRIAVVFSITPHNEHAAHVVQAVRAGKSLFVEKPLCTTLQEFIEIEDSIEESGGALPAIMVGFNRRFSPGVQKLKAFFEDCPAPLTVSIRFNAGELPADHWTQIDEIGGGRLIGEACHAIDLAAFLVGSPPVRVFAESVGGPSRPTISDDQCFITLRHANGGVSSVAYLAGGDGSMPKERIEVLGGGRAAVLDDYRVLTTHASGRAKSASLGGQDKGHASEVEAFLDAMAAGSPPPIPWEQARASSLASLLAVHSLREGRPLEITPDSTLSEECRNAPASSAIEAEI